MSTQPTSTQNGNVTTTSSASATVIVNTGANKSTLAAYLLWFFFGALGIHKFYLRQPIQGLLYLVLFLLGWATVFIYIGWVFVSLVWLGLLVDLFLIPGRVRKLNAPSTTAP